MRIVVNNYYIYVEGNYFRADPQVTENGDGLVLWELN